MTAPAAPPAVLHCPRCGAALGVSRGGRLIAGGLALARRVTFWCVRCGYRHGWSPGPGAAARSVKIHGNGKGRKRSSGMTDGP